MSTCALQVSQLSSTASNLLAVRETKAAVEPEASALELAKSKLHKDEDAPAAAAAAAKLAESVEQLEPLLAVQTTRSTSAEAGLKPSVAHQVCKA